MRVIRASTAGFCMGVSLALQKLESALKEHGSAARQGCRRICTLGPIIHNPQVLAQFEALGVACLEDAAMAKPDDYVLIRAHGIPRDEETFLTRRCSGVEDATCPRVKNAQLAIGNATKNGETLILFGECDHPEVRGLISYAHGPAHVFGCRADLDRLAFNPAQSYVLASQTTQDRETFEDISGQLAARLPNLAILSTICDATRKRQNEAAEIAAKVDVMVVVGGRQSGNTRRLANLSREAGIETFHVETAGELKPADFVDKSIAGLTAGASTPKSQIDAAEKWLLNVDGK